MRGVILLACVSRKISVAVPASTLDNCQLENNPTWLSVSNLSAGSGTAERMWIKPLHICATHTAAIFEVSRWRWFTDAEYIRLGWEWAWSPDQPPGWKWCWGSCYKAPVQGPPWHGYLNILNPWPRFWKRCDLTIGRRRGEAHSYVTKSSDDAHFSF